MKIIKSRWLALLICAAGAVALATMFPNPGWISYPGNLLLQLGGSLETGWLRFFNWVHANADTVQALAAIVFGASSFMVACLAAYIAHRQNVGLSPLVVLTSFGFGQFKGEHNVQKATFEIWNRRKHPVMLVTAAVLYRHVKFFDDDEPISEFGWRVRGERQVFLHQKENELIPAGSVRVVEAQFRIEGRVSGEEPTITVTLFDPTTAAVAECQHVGDTWVKLVRRYGLFNGTRMRLSGESPQKIFGLR